MNNVCLICGLVLGFSVLGGCADNSGKQTVTGNITFQKKPLAKGTIQFIPISKETPTRGGAMIENGTFTIPATKGLLPGTYKVILSSAGNEQASADELPGESGPAAVELIPEEYNSMSKETFEVKAGTTNTYTIDIP